MSPIRVLVVDDHPVVAQGVQHLLNGTDIAVVGSCGDASEALRAVTEEAPDVVLLDVRLPGMPVADAVTRLKAAAPRLAILLFTSSPSHPSVLSALAAGASGCLPKEADPRKLAESIRAVHQGRAVRDLRPDHALFTDELTTRQRQILQRVAMGETNREIARALELTPNTVKTYWQQTLQKLSARNRVEAIAKAYEIGLI